MISTFKLISAAIVIAILLLWTSHHSESAPPTTSLQSDMTLPLVEGSVRFAVLGSGDPEPRLQYETMQALRQVYEKFPFQFMLMVGDDDRRNRAVSADGKRLSRIFQALSDLGVEFYPSLGHREEWGRHLGEANKGNGRYYTFRKGPVRFFALDSDRLDQEQLDWFETQLRESGDLWRICLLERPLLLSSDDEPDEELERHRKLLQPLFIKHRIHVVFSGRGYPYKRLHPQKGTYHFISGASVTPKNGFVMEEELIASRFDRDLSFLLVEISGDVLYFQSISRRGETIDRSALPRLHPERWDSEQK